MTDDQTPQRPAGTWTFVTNHGAALMLVARQPDIKVAELALRLGVTERATQRVLRDLVDEGYLAVTKEGRRNRYRVNRDATMRHPVVRAVELRSLLEMLPRESDDDAEVQSTR